MPTGGFRSADMAALPPPFLSREAFRLVILLEAQKTNAVDVAALEQKFRVPPGYGDDDSDSYDRGGGRFAQSVSRARLVTSHAASLHHELMHGHSGCTRSRGV